MKTECQFTLERVEKMMETELKKQLTPSVTGTDGITFKCDRTQLVLDVAGEIFGAIKRHGLLNAEDPEALDEWVHEHGLHHHLMHLARPWTNDMEGDPYAEELDDFDADLSDVINPASPPEDQPE